MLTFEYIARNPSTGEKVTAEVQADSVGAAGRLVHEEGLAPISIKIKGGTGSQRLVERYLHRIKSKDKVLFSRQLSTLINAGLPLVQSLRNVMGQTENKALKARIGTIISDVEGGSSFSSALNKHPDTFNRVFVSLVAAGETSGTLDASLERLANQQEKDAEILSKVRGAFIYPAIVLTLMFIIVMDLGMFVLPNLIQVLYSLNVPLPLVTRIVIAFTNVFTTYGTTAAARIPSDQ